jgi:nitroimidazol reductase NimA-like FMN-containing flavoprotein (pyridoxamine 5'-phosphate oxidase superfamily)
LKKVRFSAKEREFLSRNEACRVATCKNNIPHVVPVSYVFIDGAFYFATDYGTRKLENIEANKNLALTVDIYSSVGNKAVCIQGHTNTIESGPEFKKLYDLFHSKFEWVRESPWKPGEAPFVKVIPYAKVSWGLD